MRRKEMVTAGGVTLAGLGVLAGMALGSGQTAPKVVAQRTQPVEVRTEVIRKTVNVYRRAKPHHVAAAGPGGAKAIAGSAGAPSSGYSASLAPRTRTSGAGAGVGAPSSSAAPVVRTSSSGSKSTPVSGSREGSGGQTVKTRSSGAPAGGGSGTSRTVATKSSGGHGDGGGHDD